MEKKIPVDVDGRTVYIMEHMLQDATRFGASVIKRQVKEPPKELTLVKKEIVKTVLPPKLEVDSVSKVVEAIVDEAPVKKQLGRKKKAE